MSDLAEVRDGAELSEWGDSLTARLRMPKKRSDRQKVVINVDDHESNNELRAAITRAVNHAGSGDLEIVLRSKSRQRLLKIVKEATRAHE